jgi:hypothetical protein
MYTEEDLASAIKAGILTGETAASHAFAPRRLPSAARERLAPSR